MSSEVQAKWMNSDAAGLADFRIAVEAFLQPVFQRLHIVVGTGLNRLDLAGFGFAEIGDGIVQFLECGSAERCDFAELWGGCQGFKPFHFDQGAVAYQGVFAEIGSQRVQLGLVAAIERGQGVERGEFHEKFWCR